MDEIITIEEVKFEPEITEQKEIIEDANTDFIIERTVTEVKNKRGNVIEEKKQMIEMYQRWIKRKNDDIKILTDEIDSCNNLIKEQQATIYHLDK